jgi:hypothetical protein
MESPRNTVVLFREALKGRAGRKTDEQDVYETTIMAIRSSRHRNLDMIRSSTRKG